MSQHFSPSPSATFAMPKAAKRPKTKRLKTTNSLATFTCACTGGCHGRQRELSEAQYKKHARFRRSDEDRDSGDASNDVAPSQSTNIRHSEPEPVSLPRSTLNDSASNQTDHFV